MVGQEFAGHSRHNGDGHAWKQDAYLRFHSAKGDIRLGHARLTHPRSRCARRFWRMLCMSWFTSMRLPALELLCPPLLAHDIGPNGDWYRAIGPHY